MPIQYSFQTSGVHYWWRFEELLSWRGRGVAGNNFHPGIKNTLFWGHYFAEMEAPYETLWGEGVEPVGPWTKALVGIGWVLV